VALEGDAAKVADLKIAVFGDLAPAEIIRRVGIDATVLETWEALYYDARQSRGHIGWVRTYIVDAELAAGHVDLATKLQLVAALGSLGATTILDTGSRAPANEGERLFRKKLALDLKFERAMAMTGGPGHDFRFVRHYSNLKMQEQRLKIMEQKLAEKCNQALRKHELALFRAQADLERAKYRQAAKDARKAEELALRREGQQYACELEAARRHELDLAEQKEAEARAAASPLARLCWRKAEESPVEPLILAVGPEEESGLAMEVPVTVPFRTCLRSSEVAAAAARTA
jgi:hypothetical protein